MLFRMTCWVLVLATACKQPVNPTLSVIPLADSTLDTAIVLAPYDRVADSLRILHLRDSFYAQPPVLRFADEKESDGLLKLAAWCTDTLPVRRMSLSFTEKEDRTYNAAQEPTQIKYIYRHPLYTVILTDNHPDMYAPRQLAVNGRPLRLGIELDTTLVGNEWLSHLSLDANDFSAIQINRSPWLLLEGGIEKCNGLGCGIRYYILYNPQQNRGIVLRQFRMARLIIGFDKAKGQPTVVVMDDADFNELFQYENCSGALYTITLHGRIQAVKDRYGQPKRFEGYYPMNERDTCGCICIRRHNMK